MTKTRKTLTEKLIAQRAEKETVKNDYTRLLERIFGFHTDSLDDALNDSEELAEAVDEMLETISPLERYCIEERFLHNKPLRQLTEEFRQNMDVEKKARSILEALPDMIRNIFMEEIEDIFDGMYHNSFSELLSQNEEHADAAEQKKTYSSLGAESSMTDILRYSVEEIGNGYPFGYSEMFEMQYMQGKSPEDIVRWFDENFEQYVESICSKALRRLRYPLRTKYVKSFIPSE